MTDPHGTVTEAGAVRFQRLLPAPPERVWDYLTDSALRRTWFAGGDMDLRPGGDLTFVFRNSELSHHDEEMPERFRQYEGLETHGKILLSDPPRRLVHLWGEEEVEWTLEPRGEETLLTLVHSRLPSRAMRVERLVRLAHPPRRARRPPRRPHAAPLLVNPGAIREGL